MILQLDEFRPLIHSFFDTPRTFSDFLDIFKHSKDKIDKNLLELLRFMTTNTNFPKNLTEISKKIIIKILKKDFNDFDSLISEFISMKNEYFEEEKQKAITIKLERAVNYGESLVKAIDTKNDFYWTRILNDMNDDDYEEIIKSLLVVKDEMIKIIHRDGEKSIYSINNINEYIDLEFIRRNLYHKQYNFNGLFYYIYNFLLEYINPGLKNSLQNSLKEYLELLKADCIDIESTNNETILELFKFLMDNFFLYLEISDSIDIIPS